VKFYGIDEKTLRYIVKDVSCKSWNSNVIVRDSRDESNSRGARCRMTLRVEDSSGPGARESASGRRTVAACWHVVRDVLRAVYEYNPDVRVVSGLGERDDNGKFRPTVYKNSAHFEDTFPATGAINVGSEWYPRSIVELCGHGSVTR
jgi:hypothetical protein